MKKILLTLFCAAMFSSGIFAADWEKNINIGISIPVNTVTCKYDDTSAANDKYSGVGFGANFMARLINPENNLATMIGIDLAYSSLDLKNPEDVNVSFEGLNMISSFGVGNCFVNDETTKVIGSAVIGIDLMKPSAEYVGVDMSITDFEIFIGADLYFSKHIQNTVSFFADATLGYAFAGFGSVTAKAGGNSISMSIDSSTGVVFVPRLGISIKN